MFSHKSAQLWKLQKLRSRSRSGVGRPETWQHSQRVSGYILGSEKNERTAGGELCRAGSHKSDICVTEILECLFFRLVCFPEPQVRKIFGVAVFWGPCNLLRKSRSKLQGPQKSATHFQIVDLKVFSHTVAQLLELRWSRSRSQCEVGRPWARQHSRTLLRYIVVT